MSAGSSGSHDRRSMWQSIRLWIFSTDPVRLGVLWIATTLLFFFLGGIAAIMIRAELTFPGRTFMSPEDYAAWFTLHGTVMIFFFAVPVFFGLGSILVPRMVGVDNLAFPRLNAFDFWLILLGGLLLEAGFLLGERPMAGWTSYTPLSLQPFSGGSGQDLWALGILIETLGASLAGVNFLVTILRSRRPGLTLSKLPIFVWTMLFTAVLAMFAGPVLVGALSFMWMDRNIGTWFFDPTSPHGTLLWQDLFWFYSHPATYIMVIPAFGVLSMVIPRFTGRPLFTYLGVVIASGAIAVLAFLVWWHHMFITGMSRVLRISHSVTTLAISVPTGTLIFAWLMSMRLGAVRFTTPMLFALGWIITFTMGGVNGVYMAYIPFDVYAHDTYWLVAHFHYIIFGGTVLGIFTAIYYWFPSALHRQLDERLGKLHFWGTLIGFHMTFFPMHFIGLMGLPRRVFDYDPKFVTLQVVASGGMFLVAAAMLVFLFNLGITLVHGRRLQHDPWGVAGNLNVDGQAPPIREEGR